MCFYDVAMKYHYRLRAMGFSGILIGTPENNGIHDAAQPKHGLIVGENRN
jgi:hypothetical protein